MGRRTPALAVGHGGPGLAIGGLGASVMRSHARFQQPKGRVTTRGGCAALDPHGPHELNSDPLNVAVGVGPGQSSPIIESRLVGPTNPQIQVDVAIWSVAVIYYAETGLLGAAALLAVLAMAVGAIARSSAVLLGLCARLVARRRGRDDELFALSPVWLFLGVVLSWDRLFPRAVSMKGR